MIDEAAMSTSRRHTFVLLAALLVALASHGALRAQAPAPGAKRPMTFLDMQKTRTMGAASVSLDGRWMLYTISTPDWKEAKRQSDVYLVSLQQGVSSTKQMTFTRDKNETEPRW